jgi:hypothetical protein
MSDWIALTDQEPPLGARVLVTDRLTVTFGALYPGALGMPRNWTFSRPYLDHATHWMPIPEPPA